jgi:uncharacterized SAM-binding protein YcdF (DUF218 family)
MKWLIIIPVTAVLVILGISVYLQPNDFLGCNERPVSQGTECRAADAIVVVSGGARTDVGIALYQRGWGDYLVLSGAAQDKTGPSNAAVMRQRALASGVPDSHILIDEFAETTTENARNSQSIFKQEGFSSVILVTSGYHQRRATLEFGRLAGSAQVRNWPVLSDQDWSFALWWLTPRGWWLAGGDLIRIGAFYLEGPSS